jgi:hypothetical protein
MQFPSKAWFSELQEKAAARPDRYRRLGFTEATVGVKIDAVNGGKPKGYVLDFHGYGCRSVKESAKPEAEADFVLAGPYGAWKEMIENIRANGEADLSHTLNVLSMPGVPLKLQADDQLKADLFFRFNGTLQEFFNGAADVETEFSR